jgi:hypothetical protein
MFISSTSLFSATEMVTKILLLHFLTQDSARIPYLLTLSLFVILASQALSFKYTNFSLQINNSKTYKEVYAKRPKTIIFISNLACIFGVSFLRITEGNLLGIPKTDLAKTPSLL